MASDLWPGVRLHVVTGKGGTGKTTVARLLSKLLVELDIRARDKFEDTTGEKLNRMGADEAAKLIDKATGGTLFIDEA